uniref:VWFA domain-containing protein n=1 Tax=Rhabditophanes sp. KR3021 TaxID=114890 RepID=A0AC35UHP4_9BILA
MPGLLRLINANLGHRAFKSGTVSIGNVKAKVRDAKRVELVPHGFAKDGSKLGVNAHLKWLFQKDNLKQDVFLLGKPGFLRSSVVLQYLELCNREFEYLAVTRDTTENDIKQRREVQGGSIKYSDLCAVRAAVNGRILVLEGIENAERNVLPILNNLLENREMQLECGTFLMSASKYDKLRKDYSEQELKEMKLERVHPDFSVIALGLPVPQFKGQLLDVPFRSRFQCKTVDSLTYEKLNSIITTTYKNIDETKLKAVLSVAYTLNMSKDDPSKIIDLPLFPIDSILKVSQLWNNNPKLSAYQILETCYPSTVILKTKQKTVYSDYLESFGVSTKLDEEPLNELNKSSDSFISTISNENLLARMKETYQELDFCLLGEKGSGKTTLLLELAKRVNSEVTSLVLYQDINSRDLIQERRILENGDTAWEDSLLVKACKKGDIFILDGIERVHSRVGKNKTVDRFLQLTNRPRHYIQLHRDSTIQSLTVQSTIEGGILKYSDSPLVQAIKTGAVICIDEADKAPLHVISVLKSLLDTGVLYLSDGRKIIPKGYPFTDKNEIETHPDFRIIMLANKIGYPFQGHDLFKLLGDLLAVNLVVNPSPESQIAMLKQYGPDVPDASIHKLVACFDDLREKYDNSQISYPYSLRELVHIIKHLQLYPDEALSSVVKNVFDFDVFSKDAMHHIQETFHKHGIPLGIAFPRKFFFAKRHSLNEFKSYGHMEYKTLPANFVTSKVNKLLYASKESVVDEMQHDIEMTNTRMSSFTEQENCWTIPLDRGNMVSSIIQLKNAYKTIAVATVNPPALYLLKDSETSKAGIVSISEYFRHQGPNIRITLSPYPGQDNKILLHEEVSNEVLTFDVKTQEIRSLVLQVNTFAGELFNKIKGKSAEKHWRLLPASDNALPLFYELNGKEIKILDTKNEQTNVLSFGNEDFSVQNVSYFGKNTWLVQSKDKCYKLAKINEAYQLKEIKSKFFDTQILSGNCLSDQKLLTSNNFYSIKSIDNQIKAIPRPKGQQMVKDKIPYRHTQNMHSFVDLGKTSVVLDNNLIVNLQPLWYTQKSLFPELTKPEDYDSALEVIDVNRGTIQCIPIPKHYDLTNYYNWKTDLSATNAFITPTASGDGIFVCDISGHIRKLQLNEVSLGNSLSKWSDLFEKSDQEERLHFNKDDYDMSKLRDDPRHGKVDPNNAPHTGGNTWHGGTGGYSTAGLGGIGGPYRLDAGHNITQLNEEAKLKVPEEVRKKAREMNRREYAKKLEEINMSEHDAAAYNTLKSRIENEASSLRKILLELDAKQKDMSWTKNQIQGDFDDAKLVEAITGEKNIYKRRLEAEPGTVLEEPKRLRVIFDLSGSIYRFNGMDGRLQRSLETALLVMTSLADQEKIVFDVFGHSGDGFKEKLVNKNEYKQENDQLKVIKKMLAHTQFCNSGDTTVEALEFHINELAEEGDYDEKFVILLSDANFQRYGIRPEEVAAHLNNDANVSSFLILIGSLGNEAEKLQALLPSGKCFIAKDSKELPKILQSIFLSTVLK